MSEISAMMRSLRRELRGREAEIVRLLGKFVRCESSSLDKAAVDRMGRIVADQWRLRGAKVRVLRQKNRGNHIRAEMWLGSGRPRGQILILGHLDTVYPLGTLAKMPFRVSASRAAGPGTFDMKAGLALALFAVDALRSAGVRPRKRFVFFWNSDEEIGSETSRPEIEREARRSDAVLVLEPAAGADGRLKTARKGVGTVEIIVTGRSAHAGIEPAAGVNAVHELALQIARLAKMNNPPRGITLQATVIEGGTVSNVVPHHARAEVDIRYSHLADAPKLDRKLRSLRPILPGARVEVRGGINRPPLERTPAGLRLFHRAQTLMREMGRPLDEAWTGGGSDGNFTAALGVPTLDGLGAVGARAHSPAEHVLIRSLPERAALLAGLFAVL
ncbi:MAG TPA: M20 family metallopeptidase [Candidatus Acidoferrales bacterium]|nr:M20 family metallopeptidase [Candidatus Acidoferrales bacterium]